MSRAPLFQPYSLGPLALQNRFVMAPMTRTRAPERIPTPLMAEYYAQRATAGLIVTEATQVAEVGAGGMRTPFELEAILHGAVIPTPHDHDVIAVALNERFIELGANHPIPYSDD